MTVQAHVAAFLAAIRADPELQSSTFEGVVTDRPNRYVTVFSPTPDDSAHRFTGPEARQDYTFVTHSVGTTPDQARFVADRVRACLHGQRLDVAGRLCWPIRHPVGVPMQDDQDVKPPYYYLIDEWHFTSIPA